MPSSESRKQIQLAFSTTRGLHDITKEVAEFVQNSAEQTTIGVNVFCPHTSCSLLLNENCDSDVATDLENWFSQYVQEDGSYNYIHNCEGSDDMPAHIKTALTSSSLFLPIFKGKLALGTWQGIFLWEHRAKPHTRKIILTLLS